MLGKLKLAGEPETALAPRFDYQCWDPASEKLPDLAFDTAAKPPFAICTSCSLFLLELEIALMQIIQKPPSNRRMSRL